MSSGEGAEVVKGEAEAALRSALRMMATDSVGQVALYPDPDCPNCRVSAIYKDWAERYGEPAGMGDARMEALDRVRRAREAVRWGPCREPELLDNPGFTELRRAAREALEVFGWTPGPPDEAYLPGRPAYSAIRQVENDRALRTRKARRKKNRPTEDFADVPEFDPSGCSPEEFGTMIGRVPWFASLGEHHELDPLVDRIWGWDEWVGPESLGGYLIGREESIWREGLIARAGAEAVEPAWAEAERRAIREIGARLPFEAEGDPWHGPSAAFGYAAWVASTIDVCLRLGLPIPDGALRQWAWYARGHWPCSYCEDELEGIADETEPKAEELARVRLVVY